MIKSKCNTNSATQTNAVVNAMNSMSFVSQYIRKCPDYAVTPAKRRIAALMMPSV